MVARTTKTQVLERFERVLSYGLKRNHKVRIRINDAVPLERDRHTLILSMGGGNFDQSVQTGSSGQIIPYDGSVRVSIWEQNQSSRSADDRGDLFDDQTGLFVLEQEILRLVSGKYLSPSDYGEASTTGILTSPVLPLNDTAADKQGDEVFGSSGPRSSGANERATLAIDFGVSFMWDLTRQ